MILLIVYVLVVWWLYWLVFGVCWFVWCFWWGWGCWCWLCLLLGCCCCCLVLWGLVSGNWLCWLVFGGICWYLVLVVLLFLYCWCLCWFWFWFGVLFWLFCVFCDVLSVVFSWCVEVYWVWCYGCGYLYMFWSWLSDWWCNYVLFLVGWLFLIGLDCLCWCWVVSVLLGDRWCVWLVVYVFLLVCWCFVVEVVGILLLCLFYYFVVGVVWLLKNVMWLRFGWLGFVYVLVVFVNCLNVCVEWLFGVMFIIVFWWWMVWCRCLFCGIYFMKLSIMLRKWLVICVSFWCSVLVLLRLCIMFVIMCRCFMLKLWLSILVMV